MKKIKNNNHGKIIHPPISLILYFSIAVLAFSSLTILSSSYFLASASFSASVIFCLSIL